MSDSDLGGVLMALSVVLAAAHATGYIFERLRQPRLVGEILAGILLGPFVMGRIAPEAYATLFGQAAGADRTGVVLGFVYWFGLIFLMFISGSQVRGVLAEENRGQTAWILGVGTPLPFFLVLALGLFSVLPIDPLVGAAGERMATLLVLSIAVAVTSIPVISRIFYDLRIMHTRFASLILGAAVFEDIVLWAVLAVATALAGAAALPEGDVVRAVSSHVGATMAYVTLALFVMPRVVRAVSRWRWNVFRKSSPLGYVVLVLFVYGAVAALLKVNMVFSAFLAGYGVVGGIGGTERERFAPVLQAIEQFAAATFVPMYFTLVGHRLVFGAEFSLPMLLLFVAGSSLLALLSVALGARAAGFRGLDVLNIAITTNARGGPGIVLASVAYDAGIINAAFYTTLVLAAVITSQIAGVWLRMVLSRGWPLLASNPEETWLPKGAAAPSAAPASEPVEAPVAAPKELSVSGSAGITPGEG
jgi:Kef-type K+ transport system membrane component KefB